jgi:LPXTG-site transpeptidase (sortase) family protein
VSYNLSVTKRKRTNYLQIIADVLIFAGLVLLILIFSPVIKVETTYQVRQITHETVDLSPPNTDFSIVIPKIDAISPVIANVNPNDPNIYLPALKRGVVQAAGSALPDQLGNVYLFAHSTDAFYDVGRYNAVFYLLGKLSKGDQIFIYYKGKKIIYTVDQVKIVAPNDIKYLGKISDQKTLTLQTCYPPGTTFDRLIVIANED